MFRPCCWVMSLKNSGSISVDNLNYYKAAKIYYGVWDALSNACTFVNIGEGIFLAGSSCQVVSCRKLSASWTQSTSSHRYNLNIIFQTKPGFLQNPYFFQISWVKFCMFFGR